jgi:hypothetical protein
MAGNGGSLALFAAVTLGQNLDVLIKMRSSGRRRRSTVRLEAFIVRKMSRLKSEDISGTGLRRSWGGAWWRCTRIIPLKVISCKRWGRLVAWGSRLGLPGATYTTYNSNPPIIPSHKHISAKVSMPGILFFCTANVSVEV